MAMIRRVFLAAAFVLLAGHAAKAQEWQFALTPYAWLAGMSGKVKNGAAAGSRFDVGFGKIFDHLSYPPLMLALEGSNGRFGFFADVMVLSLKSDIETRDILFNDGDIKATSIEASLNGFNRALDMPAFKVDTAAGFRMWHMSNKIKLNPGILDGRSEKSTYTFVDPILTLRTNIVFAPGWSITLLGDIGGFGLSSDLTWQALGTINYQAASWIELRLGYRHLAIDRKKIDVDFSGPILGGTVRF